MKDYYVILGVDKDAAKKDIKRAYRESVKKCHPDCSVSTSDSRAFRDVTEAYETLGDNARRAEYDKQFSNEASSSRSFEKATPSTPGAQTFPFNKNARIFTVEKPAFSKPAKSQLYCTIHLTPKQLLKDMQYPYNVLFNKACPSCRQGRGNLLLFCPECSGVGYIQQKKELVINVPKGTKNGAQAQITLDHVGLAGAVLNVVIVVDYHRRQDIWTDSKTTFQ